MSGGRNSEQQLWHISRILLTETQSEWLKKEESFVHLTEPIDE